MQELIEKLSPHDKAALIHVVEIHDKYCQQCIKHKELKHECSDQYVSQNSHEFVKIIMTSRKAIL